MSTDTDWLEAIPPSKLGMPASYKEFRPSQLEAIADIFEDEERITAIQAPVGMGKSGIGIAIAKLLGYRSVYLTFTKALQDQLMKDFEQAGLKLIKGRNNYTCTHSPFNKFSCEQWARVCQANSCSIGSHSGCSAFDCDAWAGGCTYRREYQEAAHSKLVVANYAFWVNIQKRAHMGRGLSTEEHPVDLLILDEAHAAPDGLCDLLSVRFTAEHIKQFATGLPEDPENVESWQAWANTQIAYQLERANENLGRGSAERRIQLDKFLQNVGAITRLHGEWVVDPEEKPKAWSLQPVYAYQHAQSALFSNAKKILIMSGTLTRKTLSMLGLTPHDYAWHQYPYLFPRKHAPTYWVRTAQITYRTPRKDIEFMYRMCANIMRTRADRKGIIHTVSYHRAKDFMEWLKRFDMGLYSRVMSHQSFNTADVVKRFKKSNNPSVLVSPSVTTGYDFPQTECEFVIWMKLPFPVTKSPVMKARCDNDGSYPGYLMVQELVQGLGRGMRSASDFCECFIMDNSWQWAAKRYTNLLPSWLYVSGQNAIPPAPPSIATRQQLASSDDG